MIGTSPQSFLELFVLLSVLLSGVWLCCGWCGCGAQWGVAQWVGCCRLSVVVLVVVLSGRGAQRCCRLSVVVLVVLAPDHALESSSLLTPRTLSD